MKKISYILSTLFLSVSLIGCYSTKLSQEDMNKFNVKGKEVFYGDKAVAKIGNFEYEYSRGRFQQEVSMVQYSHIYDEMTEKIVKYMASKYPKAKIEVKVIRDDENDQ